MNYKKVEVKAKDREGNVIGTGTVKQYNTDKAGQDQILKDYSIEDHVTIVNRQIKTDFRNSLARPVTPMAQLKKLAKADPAVEARITEILAEFA